MGSLYLLFAIHAGVDGTLFSMRVRIELALPFVSRVYNVIITAGWFAPWALWLVFKTARFYRERGWCAYRWRQRMRSPQFKTDAAPASRCSF